MIAEIEDARQDLVEHVDALRDSLQEKINIPQRVAERTKPARQKMIQLVRANPFMVVATSLALGALISFARRR